MNIYKFYRTELDRWYIDLPNWEGAIADLQMVSGADNMLDYMSEGGNKVNLLISEEWFEGSDLLKFQREATELENGSYYLLKEYRGINLDLEMWLCDVTKFVFGKFPENLYICKIND